MDIKTPIDKYYNDLHYAALVKLMVSYIQNCNYTPSEIRQAAILASILYEETRISYLQFPSIPESVENSLSVLHEWTDNEPIK